MRLQEATKLPDEFYKPLEAAILNSNFWQHDNADGDADYNTVWGENVDQTPAAEVLGSALASYFKEIGYPISFLVRSPDLEVNSKYLLGPDHRSYPNNIVLGGEMGMSSRGRLMMYLNMGIFDDDFDVSELNPKVVASEIASIVRHEVIHAKQYDKRAKNQKTTRSKAKQAYEDDGSIASSGDRETYLSSHIEVDAYAHEFAEHLLRKLGKKKALNVIRYADNSDDLPLPDQFREYLDGAATPKAFNNLMSKVYTHIIDLSDRKIIEAVIKRLLK